MSDLKPGGYLQEALSKTTKQIRVARGEAIVEELEMEYKREVENLEMELKKLRRKQLNNFDFHPDNALSLVMSKNVDAASIKEEDLKIALDIRNIKIKLELAKDRYSFLLGEK